jgi:hypothetical protein
LLVEELQDVYVNWLEGLGSSYRMKGYFVLQLPEGQSMKIAFEGVAFGGNYGGHNVSVNISEESAQLIKNKDNPTEQQIEDLITEVQRRLLNNEMIVDYDSIKPEEHNTDGLGAL